VLTSALSCSWKMDVSIDTTHFRLASRRHGWNRSQSASDRNGQLSFGCILEQLELLEMLESHIAANAPTAEVARDLASRDTIERSKACKAPPPLLSAFAHA
jgi:hypothetical protein